MQRSIAIQTPGCRDMKAQVFYGMTDMDVWLNKAEPKGENFKLNKNVVNHYMRYPLLSLIFFATHSNARAFN